VLALRELTGQARCAGRAYFISNGEPRPVGEIMQMLLLAAGEVPRIRRVSPATARIAAAVVDPLWRLLRLRRDPPVSRFLVEHLATAHWFDIGAAARDFGYRPEVSIDEGLQRLAAAWRSAPTATKTAADVSS
jgi:nucleoside-diphosphate-sugar epimerase